MIVRMRQKHLYRIPIKSPSEVSITAGTFLIAPKAKIPTCG